MFEKEKHWYLEDCKTHDRPWELWQSALANNGILNWIDLYREPNWSEYCVYRRKPTTFEPEYYSGLNWRDAEYLIGKTVECTNNPDAGWKVGKLQIATRPGEFFNVDIGNRQYFNDYYTYIRTCEETFKHQTINIGGVELPMPETVAPANGTKYWLAPTCDETVWNVYDYDVSMLKAGRVHLTKDNAKAWADWWRTAVVDKMK